MNTGQTEQKRRKWLYPVIYVVFIIISMLPLYAEKPYAPQDTQDVIINLLMVAVKPYEFLAPVFHIATLIIGILIAVLQDKMSRVLAAYIGLNYLVIAFVQSFGNTEKYGFVVHTGALIAYLVLGITWITVAVRGDLRTSYKDVPWHFYILIPLALLVFWAPYDTTIKPDFSPIRLLTSPDYGLTFCFTTPVFLLLLILFHPKVNTFAFRITAFNGFIYGLFNMTHFFNPELRWMGVLHLPLVIISFYALILSALKKRKKMSQ